MGSLAPYDGLPSEINLDTIDIWIMGFYPMVKPLVGKVSEFFYAEPNSHYFEGNVHVKINVHKPLNNAVTMVKNNKCQICIVKYERAPDWCVVCGHLDHLYEGHGDVVHPPSMLLFKNLRAS